MRRNERTRRDRRTTRRAIIALKQRWLNTTTKLFGGTIHSALVHAATAYDRRQSTRRGYNIYALAQYLMRIEDVEKDIARGVPLRAALLAGFHDRLLDCLLTAVGESKFTTAEMRGQPLTYERP